MNSSLGLRGWRVPGEPHPPVVPPPRRPPRRCTPPRPSPRSRIAGAPLWPLPARAEWLADRAPVLRSAPPALAGTMAAADQAAARRQRPRQGPPHWHRQHQPQKARLPEARPRPELCLQARAQAPPGSIARKAPASCHGKVQTAAPGMASQSLQAADRYHRAGTGLASGAAQNASLRPLRPPLGSTGGMAHVWCRERAQTTARGVK